MGNEAFLIKNGVSEGHVISRKEVISHNKTFFMENKLSVGDGISREELLFNYN